MSDSSFSIGDEGAMLRLFRSVVEHLNDAVLITTPQLELPGPKIIYANAAFTQLSGYESAEIVGQTPRILQGELTDKRVTTRLRKELERGETFAGTVVNYRKDGGAYEMEWTVYPQRDAAGAVLCFVSIQRDAAQRSLFERQIAEKNRQLEEANEHLSLQATTDGLTGLHNVRSFQAKMVEEFERARRYQLPLSLVMLDVDHFKGFNDNFGHPAGDVVLQSVGRIMRETARAVDFAARVGGEEFLVILPNTDAPGAAVFGERLRSAIEKSDWPQRAITVSMGTASRSAQTKNFAEMVSKADAALYLSKQNGRNRVTSSE